MEYKVTDWSLVRVEDLISSGALAINDGYRVTNRELGPAGIPFVRGGDIGDGSIATEVADHILPEFANRVEEKLSQPEDVAFITKGSVGRVGLMRPYQPRVVFAPQVSYWRALDRTILNPRFLFYLLRGPRFQANLHAVKTHGSMVADYVSLSDQKGFSLLLPPTYVQEAISEMLSWLDDKIELNSRINQTLEAMARAIFKSYFVDLDGERGRRAQSSTGGNLPDGWVSEDLGDCCELKYGKAMRSEDRSFGAIPVFGSNGQIGWHDMPLVKGPGIVIGRKGNPGTVTWNSSDFFPIDTTFYVVPQKASLSMFYLFHALSALNLASLSADSAVPGLGRNLAYRSKILVPPSSMMERFDRYASPLQAKVDCNLTESKTLSTLRDTLLPKLLSGEIRVKQAEKIVEAIL